MSETLQQPAHDTDFIKTRRSVATPCSLRCTCTDCQPLKKGKTIKAPLD